MPLKASMGKSGAKRRPSAVLPTREMAVMMKRLPHNRMLDDLVGRGGTALAGSGPDSRQLVVVTTSCRLRPVCVV